MYRFLKCLALGAILLSSPKATEVETPTDPIVRDKIEDLPVNKKGDISDFCQMPIELDDLIQFPSTTAVAGAALTITLVVLSTGTYYFIY